LYRKKDYESWPQHIKPEIQSVPLAETLLRLKQMKKSHPLFYYASSALKSVLDPPPPEQILSGYKSLKKNGLIYASGNFSQSFLNHLIYSCVLFFFFFSFPFFVFCKDEPSKKPKLPKEYTWDENSENPDIEKLKKYDEFDSTGLGSFICRVKCGLSVSKLLAIGMFFPPFLPLVCVIAASLELDRDIFQIP